MPNSEQSDLYDVAIAGGGPSGRIAALSFAQLGLSSVLLAPSQAGTDGRTTALWQQSLAQLENLGVWELIQINAAALKKMRMIDDTGRLVRAPEVVFDSAELKIEEFGFNILNSELNSVLEEKCDREPNLTIVRDSVISAEYGQDSAVLKTAGGQSISARLVIAADGRNSLLRQSADIDVSTWKYPQVAVVLNLEHRLPHKNVSTEFHTPTGPFTLVPLPGRQSSLVCVETAEGAQKLLAMAKKELERELERRAHSILGPFKLVSKVQSFSLSGLTAKKLVAPRLALIGETAHVFPPIGAQGLNLSLRDISDLVGVMARAVARQQDIGSPAVLHDYEAKRFRDIRTRTNAVDVLNRSLLTGFLPVQVARSTGMYLAGKVGPFRRLLMREGMAPGSGFQLHK
ncbi:MAG: UbiH/UbiF family hydroxylase [Roseibium sp.]|uniref:UbiH/UbiF family hydroxylase n=1 Tax=Roseibium sp. TaxID=1936156 RepID=UPI00260D8E75|nr:UbiH/UbiF family hydroxylase [Roseibium sp.]MCV0425233.1 UbiH/UbiF family hydroxylase [Roseibium sp.]